MKRQIECDEWGVVKVDLNKVKLFGVVERKTRRPDTRRIARRSKSAKNRRKHVGLGRHHRGSTEPQRGSRRQTSRDWICEKTRRV